MTIERIPSLPGRQAERSDEVTLAEPLRGLLERIRSRTATVAVLGQGYVGFPFAQRAAERGFPTTGLDPDEAVRERSQGMNVHPSYRASVEMAELRRSEVVIVAVPTPTSDQGTSRQPDLSYVRSALAAIGAYPHQDGAARLVVIESTYAPGTTRALAREFLASNGVLGETIAIGYSPERIDPGNAHYSVDNIPKVVSGLCPASAVLVEEFYSAIVETTVPASSVEAAEACKLLENTFRFVNITFAQEFEQYCSAIGISAREATRLAATKPFGYMPFIAGAGIGGHCIAEDPYFLHDAMLNARVEPGVLSSAIRNHEQRARVVADRIVERLGGMAMGKYVMLLGVSYKAGVADVRRSPATEILKELRARGVNVSYYDPLVPMFEGMRSETLDGGPSRTGDLAVMLMRHPSLDAERLTEAGWDVFDPMDIPEGTCASL